MLNLHAERVSVAMPKDALLKVLSCAALYLDLKKDIANGVQIRAWVATMCEQLGHKGRISIKNL